MSQVLSKATSTAVRLTEEAYEKFFKKCLEVPDLDVFSKNYLISKFEITKPINGQYTTIVHKDSGRSLVVQEPRLSRRMGDNDNYFLDVEVPVYEYGMDGAEIK